MSRLVRLLHSSDFAAKKHKGQKRKGANGGPYINHPLEVARLLAEVGTVTDYDVLIAAVLHDTIEDTDTTEDDITSRFGKRVCRIVLEVTDDKTLPKVERKRLQIEHAPHLSHEAKQIKIADKISNIEDIHDNPPENWSVSRRLLYIRWAGEVVDGLRGANRSLEDLFDRRVRRALKSLESEE